MKNKEILRQIVGIEGPIGTTQWDPPTDSASIASDIITDLENRRVLFNPMQMEDAGHCVQSVSEIRDILTDYSKDLAYQTPLDKQVRRMRKASMRFMDGVGHSNFDSYDDPVQRSILRRELNHLREKFGKALAEIAVSYEVDVDDNLASIIPFDKRSH